MAPRQFYIAGLPRSRTSWLANLLTTERSFCHHDLLRELADPLLLPERLGFVGSFKIPHLRAVGCAETGLGLFPAAVPKDARLIVIRREIGEAFAAERAAAPSSLKIDERSRLRLWKDAAIGLEALSRRHGVVRIRYEDLGDEDAIRFLWSYCLGERFHWNPARYALLEHLVVTEDLGRYALHPQLLARLAS